MVWASQLAVPRLAISRMFGVRSMLSASGRRPSIETTTTSGVGGGGVGVGGAVGTVGGAGGAAGDRPERGREGQRHCPT